MSGRRPTRTHGGPSGLRPSSSSATRLSSPDKDMPGCIRDAAMPRRFGAAHSDMNDSADFVMYWWDRAADVMTRKQVRHAEVRASLLPTRSTQVFQRKADARWHSPPSEPLSVIWAVPDHPWTKATPDAAAVRIAMTVAEGGSSGTVELLGGRASEDWRWTRIEPENRLRRRIRRPINSAT